MVEPATGDRNVPGSNTTGAVSVLWQLDACRCLVEDANNMQGEVKYPRCQIINKSQYFHCFE